MGKGNEQNNINSIHCYIQYLVCLNEVIRMPQGCRTCREKQQNKIIHTREIKFLFKKSIHREAYRKWEKERHQLEEIVLGSITKFSTLTLKEMYSDHKGELTLRTVL